MTSPVAGVAMDSEDLCRRLRGQYRIPIRDGLGAAGGEEPNNANEFVRTFPTSPIMHEAADAIEYIRADLEAQASAYKERVASFEREIAFLVDRADEYEREIETESGDGAVRYWHGHVVPSIARLRALLNGADR